MMMRTFAEFWAVSILFVITPGADWAYAISAGLRGPGVAPAVLGMLFGHFVATLVVATGVGALVASIPAAVAMLTIGGSAYLVWLGVNMLASPSVPSASQVAAPDTWTRWAVKGFGVSGMNPKVLLLFLALLPQFTDPTSPWSVPAQVVALGLVHIFSCGVVYFLVGFGAKTVLRARPRVARVVSRLSGAMMIVIATILVLNQIRHGLVQ